MRRRRGSGCKSGDLVHRDRRVVCHVHEGEAATHVVQALQHTATLRPEAVQRHHALHLVLCCVSLRLAHLVKVLDAILRQLLRSLGRVPLLLQHPRQLCRAPVHHKLLVPRTRDLHLRVPLTHPRKQPHSRRRHLRGLEKGVRQLHARHVFGRHVVVGLPLPVLVPRPLRLRRTHPLAHRLARRVHALHLLGHRRRVAPLVLRLTHERIRRAALHARQVVLPHAGSAAAAAGGAAAARSTRVDAAAHHHPWLRLVRGDGGGAVPDAVLLLRASEGLDLPAGCDTGVGRGGQTRGVGDGGLQARAARPVPQAALVLRDVEEHAAVGNPLAHRPLVPDGHVGPHVVVEPDARHRRVVRVLRRVRSVPRKVPVLRETPCQQLRRSSLHCLFTTSPPFSPPPLRALFPPLHNEVQIL
eukprot:Rhum_TRINITY_DN14163_c33_g1::Rhum_TRINITY_DN14163_c33_g1_i1::g.69549::m.69549